MTVNLLILFTSIITAVLAIVSATSTLWDKDKFAILKFTRAGWFFLFFSLLLLALPVIQKVVQDHIDEIKEAKREADTIRRDSTMKAGYDSSLTKNTEIVTTILAKYGYQLDTANMLLRKRRESADTVKVIEGLNPVIELGALGISDSITNQTHAFTIPFYSYDAGSGNFNVTYSAVVEDSVKNLTYGGNKKLFPDDLSLAKGNGYLAKAFLTPSNFTPIVFYFWVRGTYKNIDKSKTFIINNVYEYRNGQKFTGMAVDETRDKIINLCKSHEK